MLSSLLRQQKEFLDQFYARLDLDRAEEILTLMKECEGEIFLTGIGKSGFIAKKIAATLLSTGTKSCFLSPLDALHGDLGMVDQEDLLIILSKSGETEELLQLLPFVRNKGTCIVAVTSNAHSRLAHSADHFIELPCERELCPFDLAPTTSTEIQLLFGDVLAIALMQEKGVTQEIFIENHPAGRIGKRVNVKVRDLMLDRERSPLCGLHDRLEDVLSHLSEKRCGCLVVIDEKGKLEGIFTDGDLRRALQAKGEKALKESVGDLMTPAPKAIKADALAWEAMQLMEADQKKPVMILPVVSPEEKVLGVIKMHDILQAGL